MSTTTAAIARMLPKLSSEHFAILERVTHNGRQIHLDAGQKLFHQGDLCDRYLLVTEGGLRIQKMDLVGHEIVLNHIQAGEQCSLNNTCLLGGHHYPADAVAETETTLAVLSRAQFHELLESLPEFRDVIFRNIKQSVTELVNLVEEVAFEHMDHRLAHLLITRADSNEQIRITHQALANELGSAREVISRLLKRFEKRRWVKLHRGMIEITDRTQLSAV